MYGGLHLFPILPHSVMFYAALRKAHTILAYLLLELPRFGGRYWAAVPSVVLTTSVLVVNG